MVYIFADNYAALTIFAAVSSLIICVREDRTDARLIFFVGRAEKRTMWTLSEIFDQQKMKIVWAIDAHTSSGSVSPAFVPENLWYGNLTLRNVEGTRLKLQPVMKTALER